MSFLTSDGVMSSNGSFSVRCVWEGGALIRRGHLFNISSQKEVANYKGGGNSRVYGNNLMSMVHSDIVHRVRVITNKNVMFSSQWPTTFFGLDEALVSSIFPDVSNGSNCSSCQQFMYCEVYEIIHF